MPKKEIDYSKCIIYKLVCDDLNIKDIYVGHTTDFRRRKNRHKQGCINENLASYNFRVYDTIRKNGGWDNWSMIEIEKYSCNDSNEATARERHWLEELQANLNMITPSRTQEERAENGNDRQKKYYQGHKEVISEKRKEQNHSCECGGHYRTNSRTRHFRTKLHCDYILTLS